VRLWPIVYLAIQTTAHLAAPLANAAENPGWPRGGWQEADKIQASPLLVDLNADGREEILVPSFGDRLYVYRHTGQSLSGWPQQLGFSDGSIGSVAVGDVDGDGSVEIVVAGDDLLSRNAAVKVFEVDGTLRASVSLGATASAKATPCLIDCYRYKGPTEGDRHAAAEIVLRDGDGWLHVLYWNGSGFSDFCNGTSTYRTVTDDTLKDRYGAQPITSSASAVGNGSGQTTIVVGSTDSKVYRWSILSTAGINWSITPQTPFQVTGRPVKFLGSPALVDLDRDGDYETVIGGSDGWLYVWEGSGSGAAFPGWPRQVSESIVSSPAVADLNFDGNLEIVAGSNDGKVYVWDSNGSLLPGWPAATQGDVFASPVVAHLDRETTGAEVVAASLDGHLYAWTQNGTLLPRWPKRLNTPIFASPAIGNIHGGDRMAIVTAGYNGRIFVWDLSMRSADTGWGWKQFRNGPARQGH